LLAAREAKLRFRESEVELTLRVPRL